MDLKRERQIKFWLTTISKVLIIALVLFKLIDFDFNKKQETPLEEKAIETNLPKEQVTNTITPTAVSTEKKTLPKTQTTTKKHTTSTKTTAPIKATYAKLELVVNSFIWLRDKQKLLLKIVNSTIGNAENITIKAIFVYDTEEKLVTIKQKSAIAANGILTIDFPLIGLPTTKLPKTIKLCIHHESKDLHKKNWLTYILGNKITTGAIETRSIIYHTLNTSNTFYTGTAPNCTLKTFSKITPVVKNDETIVLEKINSTTKLFLTGLNNKSSITIKSTATNKLYTYLSKVNHKKYSYGFNNQFKIISHNKNTALVKLSLSETGRANYIKLQSTNESSANNLFHFLERQGIYWVGKLVNKNGIWKFDVY